VLLFRRSLLVYLCSRFQMLLCRCHVAMLHCHDLSLAYIIIKVPGLIFGADCSPSSLFDAKWIFFSGTDAEHRGHFPASTTSVFVQ